MKRVLAGLVAGIAAMMAVTAFTDVMAASGWTRPPISLTATALGGGKVKLVWSDYVAGSADSATIDVYRDGSNINGNNILGTLVATVPNPLPIPPGGNTTTLTGEPTENFHSYRVCEDLADGDDAPAVCSNFGVVFVQ